MAERHVVLPGDAGQRVDRYLRKLLREVPLGALYRWLRQGRIRVDGRRVAPFDRLVSGAVVSFALPEGALDAKAGGRGRRQGGERRRRRGELEVVHRDEHLMAVVKPAGMAVHGGSGVGGDHLEGWLQEVVAPALPRRSRAFQPAPAHRLDRGTSGLVLVGLGPEGLRGATAAFREGRVEKEYLAVVHGVPVGAGGVVTDPLRRIDSRRRDRPKVVVDAGGQPAETVWELVRVQGNTAVLRVWPRTGRLHQIRAHLAHLGHPVVGDLRYGGGTVEGEGILLHAYRLRLEHPVSGAELEMVAVPPARFPDLGRGG